MNILDDLDSDISQATSDLSNVCRSMVFAPFAVAMVDVWNGNSTIVSFYVLIIAMSTILIDVVQYCTTAILSTIWYTKVEKGIIDSERLEKEQTSFRRICVILLVVKVSLVLICFGLIIIILLKHMHN